MLLDSFALLVKAESSFQDIYIELQKYFERHKDWQFIDPTAVSRDLPLLDAFNLAGALDEAVHKGLLRAKFTVLTPDGVVASDLFDSPREIPSSLPDRFENPFETKRYPLVAIFEAVEDRAESDYSSGAQY